MNSFFDSSLHYFNIFLLLPIWWILIWIIISASFFGFKKILKQKIHNIDYLIVIILSLLSFVLIDFNSYKDNTLNSPQQANITYWEYLKHTHKEAELIIQRKFVIPLASLKVWSITLITLTVLQILWTYMWSMYIAAIFSKKNKKEY